MPNQDGFVYALKQQKLPAHQYSCSSTCMLAFVFILGIFCITIGIALTMDAKSIQEEVIPYNEMNTTFSRNLSDFGHTFYIYYQIEGLSQLILDMRNSYDFEHFANADYTYICSGESTASREWRKWFKKLGINSSIYEKANKILPYSREAAEADNRIEPVPCGKRAQLFFTDEITMYDANGLKIELYGDDITWKNQGLWSEYSTTLLNTIFTYQPLTKRPFSNKLFKNPNGFEKSNASSFFVDSNTGTQYDMPANWTKPIWEMENAMENEDFISWMTPAYAPTFRKLWRKVITNSSALMDNVSINVKYNWNIPMSDEYFSIWKMEYEPPQPLFKKSIVISTVSWAGGKNNFLGIAYLIVGIIILFIGCAIAIKESCCSSDPYDESEEIRWRKNY